MNPEPVLPREKLRRARALFGLGQKDVDRLAGVPDGRTFTYERQQGGALPPREYLAVLVAAWKERAPTLTVDWFFDGVDDAPVLSATLAELAKPTGREVPIASNLPYNPSTQDREYPAALCRVSFHLPPLAVYRRIVDDRLAPYLRRGDLCLVLPTTGPRHDSLVVVADNGLADVFVCQIVKSAPVAVPITSSQATPTEYRQLGLVAEVVRTLAGGFRIVYECESGLTLPMLNP